MPGSTANGWPYALPADARVDWPALSQSQATKIDTDLTIGKRTTWTPASGWSITAGTAAWCTRLGPLILLEGRAQPSANAAVSASGVAIGTVPATHRPASTSWAPAMLITAASPGGEAGWLIVDPTTGVMTIASTRAVTVNANSPVTAFIVYRGV